MLEEQITIVQNSLEAHTLGTLGEKLLESGVSAEDLLTIFSAHGVIPGGRLGTLQTKAIVDKLTRLENRLKEARTDANRREERFEIQLDTFRLVGTVGELWGQRRVIPLLGKANPKRLLRAWVKQLCLQSANKEHVNESLLVGPDESYRLRRPEDPKAVLQSLANVFLASREEPIPFEVGAAFAFASRVEADNKRTPESWKEARESLENSYSPHAPRQAAFRGIAIIDIESKSGHDFATTSETVFRTLIQCREEYP